jgi:sugar phosphate isomerase/epimerase
MKLACICGCFNRSFDAGTMDQTGFIRHCATTLGVRGVELQDIHFPQTRSAYLQELRRTAADLGLAIVGIGVHNDFGRSALLRCASSPGIPRDGRSSAGRR